MPASIFNGTAVKILKDQLRFKSGALIIAGSSADPTSVAQLGSPSDIYLREGTSGIYIKQDSGTTTNWSLLSTGPALASQFTLLNNQVTPAAVTGFLINSAANKFFTSEYSISRIYSVVSFTTASEDSTLTTNIGTSFNAVTRTVKLLSDGTSVVGGDFTTFNGNTRNRIIKLNADGTENATFVTNSGTGFDFEVYKTAINSSNQIFLVGNFSTYNSVSIPIAFIKLNSNGTPDTAFNTNLGTGFNSDQDAVAVQADQKILVGGNSTTFNGNIRNGLVRVNTDGTEDTAFYTNLGTGFSGGTRVVKDVYVQADQKILVGGDFTTFNGNARAKLVRLNADGTEDTAFYTNLGTGFGAGIVDNIIQQADNNKILVGGEYTSFNGNTRNRLVRLNADGTEDTAFYTALGSAFNAQVRYVQPLIDGKILVTGVWSTFNGNIRNQLIRLNSDGTEDTAFYTSLGTAFTGQTWQIALQSNYAIIVSGNYATGFNGNTVPRLVRLNQAFTTSDTELMEVGQFSGVYRPSNTTWTIVAQTYGGDDAGIVFTMNSTGQLQYTSTNMTGTQTESLLKYVTQLL